MNDAQSRNAWLYLFNSLGPMWFSSTKSRQPSATARKIVHQNSCGHGYTPEDAVHHFPSHSKPHRDHYASMIGVSPREARTMQQHGYMKRK